MKLKKACLFLCLLLVACTNEDYPYTYPVVKTLEVTDITDEQAVFNGDIQNLTASEKVLEYGFVYNGLEGDHTAGVKILLTGTLEEGMISYQNIHDLWAGKTYYIRAFVKTDKHTIYGNEVSFQSQGSKAPLITDFEPKQLFDGSELVITGENFSTLKNATQVTIGENAAEIIAVTRTTIKVIVPMEPTWGDRMIKVRVDNKEIVANQTLYLLGPEIHSVSPTELREGDVFVIQGENLALGVGAQDKVLLIKAWPGGASIFHCEIIENSTAMIKARVPTIPPEYFFGADETNMTMNIIARDKSCSGGELVIKRN